MRKKRSFDKLDPGPMKSVPLAPFGLDKAGRAAWELGAKYLVERELLHTGDLPGLEIWAGAVSMLDRVTEELASAELIVDAAHGPKKNPLVDLHQKYNLIVRGWSQTLMLAPFSRTGLTKAEKAPAPSAKGSEWDSVISMPEKGNGAKTPRTN